MLFEDRPLVLAKVKVKDNKPKWAAL